MHRFIYFILIFVLLSILKSGLGSDITPNSPIVEEETDFHEEDDSSLLPPSTITAIIESVVEDIVDNVTEPIITTTIINGKQFLTEVKRLFGLR
jgi:hypothetical protein